MEDNKREALIELVRFLREVLKVKDEFVGVIEGLAVRPVLKPLDDAVKRLVLKELYLWFLGAYASLLGSFLILRLRG